MKNKYQSMLIKKTFKKHPPYRCCILPDGNKTKMSRGLCCTYPQWYHRHDVKNQAIWDARHFETLVTGK